MAALLLCIEAAQQRLPCLLVTSVGGRTTRECVHVHTERRTSSKCDKIIRAPESDCLYLDYKAKLILPAILIEKDSSFESMYNTLHYYKDSLFSTSSTLKPHSLQRGLINSGLQIYPHIFWRHKGRNGLHKYYYHSVRHASDSLRERITEGNRSIRERFAAREKEWEALVDVRLLRPEDLRIREAHKGAVAQGHFTYNDPTTGYRVMTRLRHFLRGSCCGNACRHVSKLAVDM